MEQDVAISVQNVSMAFNLNKEKVDNLKEYIIKFAKRELEYKKFYALKNISFEVKKGEHLAILGFNGAGKSTLLKTIVGVYKPTTGSIETKGVVAPLLELGAGFDPNYTGKENIFLYGAILGYSRDYLQSKYNEIVEFSELGHFIDVPLKNYSSGMKARLGFSIATAVEPDVLILDEVLSVGDAKFRAKSLRKVQSLFEKGVTVIFVSHSIEQVQAICDKAILLNHGEIIASGDVDDVTSVYGAMTAGAKLENAKIRQQEKALMKAVADKKNLKVLEAKAAEAYNINESDIKAFDEIISKLSFEDKNLLSAKASLKRSEFVTMFYELMGSPYSAENSHNESSFMDVKDKSVYYYDAACWAYDNGITTQAAFKPDSIITREQAVAFVYRYAAKFFKEQRVTDTKIVDALPDHEALSMWAVKPVAWAYSKGYIDLTADGRINPVGLTLGVHAAKLFNGLLSEIKK